MEAILAAALPSLISAGASGLSAVFGRNKGQISPDQRRRQQVIDQLMASVQGSGPFADLFRMDEDAFQKSFVEPAKQRFRDQISPQIQQSFIQSGQQRGTGLDDTLSRAGVDLDQMLNQQFAQQQQAALQRKLQTLGLLTSAESGAPGPDVGAGTAFLQGIGGAIGSSGFFDDFFTRRSQDQTSGIFGGGAGGSTGAPIAQAGSAGVINRKGFRN